MCQECARIQAAYEKESERLAAAQRDLARYEVRDDQSGLCSLMARVRACAESALEYS